MYNYQSIISFAGTICATAKSIIWFATWTVVGDIDGGRPIGLFVTRRFLRESARHEASRPENGTIRLRIALQASRPENGTIRLRIALRIFLGLGKTPEMAC